MHGFIIAAANHPARKIGLSIGMPLTDARARIPDINTQEIDRVAERKALESIAEWMDRWTPITGLDGPDGLMLDVTGCAHLYGEEEALMRKLSAALNTAGYQNHMAIAGTVGAANGLARYQAKEGVQICLRSGYERQGLRELPFEALRLDLETIRRLRRFGLRRIEQIYDIDRKALARRFQSRKLGESVCLRLEQALGERQEPLVPFRVEPEHIAHLQCPDPIVDQEAIEVGLRQLLADLCEKLTEHGKGGQCFAFKAFRSDGDVSSIGIRTARPVRDPRHIFRLFAEHIEKIDPGLGIDCLSLSAVQTGELNSAPLYLSSHLTGNSVDVANLSQLADRLIARLGQGSVSVPLVRNSHLPQKAETIVPYGGILPSMEMNLPVRGPRPVRSLLRPEPIRVLASVPDGPPLSFVWRRIARTVARADGPERIGPDWWTSLPSKGARQLPRTRDYYRIEDHIGRRFWVFREGLYDDGRGGSPEWYLQGLFA